MIRNFFYQGCIKKVLWLFLISIMFFSTISNVYASILTIENISSQFNQSAVVEELKTFGSSISSKVNTIGNTLDIYVDDEKIFSFNYGTNYIEYNNRSAVITQDNASEDIITVFWLEGIIESILELSGYNDKTLSEDGTYTDTYDTYGFQLEMEHYEYSGSEGHETWSMSGDYVRYFKMSFDTDKIDALMTKYGVDVETQDSNNEIIASLTPTIEAKSITENSVTLYPHINYINTDSNNTIDCYVYRSTSENGVYEKISDFAVNCLDSVGLIDDGLKSNTTYYYKALVVDGTKYSDVLKVTTKSTTQTSTISTTKDGDLKENPKTGLFVSVVTIMVALICSLVALIIAYKKSLFKHI